jgi:hypothetical protein
MGDLLGEDFAIAHSHTLYRCLDRLVVHKRELFSYLQARWRGLFAARFDVLLYWRRRTRRGVAVGVTGSNRVRFRGTSPFLRKIQDPATP